ncbi:MAG: excinuclease ABC subunit UvrA, partial [Veillonella sp.]|nr:excinuclease ABC subunit UvrA [Veillonella sp.]
PEDYSDLVLSLRLGQTKSRDEILSKLVDIQYTRNDMNFIRGTFRVQGDTIEIFPAAYSERAIRVELFGDEIDRLVEVDALTGEVIAERKHVAVYPASHYVTTKEKMKIAVERIEAELDEQLAKLKAEDRLLEAQRLEQRTRYDIEMMQEMGYCSGIENYSRHMSERKAGEAPYTLIDYFPDDFLIMVDESHVTIPQVRAMYNGDRARKESLIEYGFRLPSALDNRPLKFDEFVERINQIVYVSATPGPYEMEVETNVAEQIIRPTGLLDPSIEIRPIKGQMDDLLGEIHKRATKNERVLVTTLTKKMAEDLTEFLKEMGVRVRYLHSDIVTIERAEIIRDLRAGVFDVLVGINLLREGLDMPEVSLVAILDADKEGFLRSDTAMIQTIGRAARNVNGHVIMYADRVTGSMQRAMDETDRRRAVQEAYNIKHHITPKSVSKDVKELIELTKIEEDMVTDGKDFSPKKVKKKSSTSGMDHGHEPYAQDADATKVAEITAEELYNKIEELDRQMKAAAKQLEFEKAAKLRDQLGELRQQWSDMHSVGESKLKKPRKNSNKAEGQRRYVESLSAYARQFLGQMDKPDVDYIEGLSPAISIDQKTTSRNPRSTVGTVTEIYDYLRLLFARVGHAHCPECGKPITQQTIQQMTDDVMSFPEGTKILILAPMIQGKKGEHKSVFEQLRKEGFVRARVDGVVRTMDEDIVLEKNKKHSIDIVVDRLVVKEGIESRLADSMETASKWAEGIVIVQEVDGPEHMYSQNFACPDCHISLPKIEPRMFSFNSPFGACPSCLGIGSTMEVDEERVIPDGSISFADGCVQALSSNPNAWFMRQLEGLLKANGYSLESTYDELPKALQKKVMYGTKDKVAFTYENMRGEEKEFFTEYEGILPMVKRRHSEASTDSMREEFEKFMSIKPCTTCHGARLKPEVLAITIGDKNINEVTQLTIKEALDFFSHLQLTNREQVIGAQILKEINARLGFLNNVGLDYLTMNRSAGTLSGGEAQRIRLATQIGSGLVGVLYILDEPSIGLHQRDNDRLIDTLKGLRDLGNTLLVVEHDEDTMRAADYLVDIGPGAGEHGGQVIAAGTVDEVMQVKDSITGQYLSGRKFIALPDERRKPGKNCIEIRGAKENNLQNINVKFPIGLFTVVTGVSGSGKSTLINEILY